MAAVLKTAMGATSSWVRIPRPPRVAARMAAGQWAAGKPVGNLRGAAANEMPTRGAVDSPAHRRLNGIYGCGLSDGSELGAEEAELCWRRSRSTTAPAGHHRRRCQVDVQLAKLRAAPGVEIPGRLLRMGRLPPLVLAPLAQGPPRRERAVEHLGSRSQARAPPVRPRRRQPSTPSGRGTDPPGARWTVLCARRGRHTATSSPSGGPVWCRHRLFTSRSVAQPLLVARALFRESRTSQGPRRGTTCASLDKEAASRGSRTRHLDGTDGVRQRRRQR